MINGAYLKTRKYNPAVVEVGVPAIGIWGILLSTGVNQGPG